MNPLPLNTFLDKLREACGRGVLDETWLLAPSLRIGFQWLDAITRAGRPVVNVRVKTMRHLALDLAAPRMTARGVTFLRGARLEVLIDRMFSSLRDEGGYLAALEPSPGLTRTLLSAVRDLRLAGLDARRLEAKAFEVAKKGREVGALLGEYERLLREGAFADYADVLRFAVARIESEADALPPRLLLPADEEERLTGLERALWRAIPAARRQVLAVDRPAETPPGLLTNAGRLRWLAHPAEAPPPVADDTAAIFRAVGEVNEVREVLRRCVEENIPFDDVEVLHTDAATYVPLMFEVATRILDEAAESLPVTFADGLPTRYSRPGRALSAWVAWVREGYPQAALVQMLHDGLLAVPDDAAPGVSSARMAAVFRPVGIGAGRGRYLSALNGALNALRTRLKQEGAGADDERPAHEYDLARGRLAALAVVQCMVAALLAVTPPDDAGQAAVLDAAAAVLTKHVHSANRLDQYARKKLLEEIKGLRESLPLDEEVAGLDVWRWLADLPAAATVAGLGPRPGKIHVAPLLNGGHSARRHTFIVGLDDSRFPGAGLQDPVLLDGERCKLSADLPTAAGRQQRKGDAFLLLLARLRGRVTMSYACRSLVDDREMFPGAALLSAYRVLSGEVEGDEKSMAAWVKAPASFAPAAAERCIDSTEWWLWRLCCGAPVREPEAVVGRAFAHLGRGARARAARRSDAFTAYDGYVPEAGRDLDPTAAGGPVLSASRLESLGRCPLDYFFRYVLKIEPPEEYAIDPDVWLDALQRGSLLHEVFREFMAGLCADGLLPDFDRDRSRLKAVFERRVAAARAETPPPNDEAWWRDYRWLERTTDIFLIAEAYRCRDSLPRWFEVAVGMPSGDERTPLDSETPVAFRLADGRAIRIRGRIDRIDEVAGADGKRFRVWDYKTGSSRRYRGSDPFNGGRHVQGIFYLALAHDRLRDRVDPQARVTTFGYLFPSPSEEGADRRWSDVDLAAGDGVVARLCETIAAGCFPASNLAEDMEYSDYLAAIGDAAAAAEAAGRKLAAAENAMLAPLRDLRAIEINGSEEESDEN